MNWDEMSPRERDALVAEKVMGWRIINGGPFEYQGDHVWLADSANYPHVTRCTGEPLLLWRGPDKEADDWNPSTNIAAAWEVVTEMFSDAWDVNIDAIEGTWYCDFTRPVHGPTHYVAASTAPEAICLAALRAVGVDI